MIEPSVPDRKKFVFDIEDYRRRIENAIQLYKLINHQQLKLPPEMMVMITTCLSKIPEFILRLFLNSE